MKILGVETSCDETSISIIEATGGLTSPKFKIISHALISQSKLHEKYGGVFPNLAKREHAKNLVPILTIALNEAGQKPKKKSTIDKKISEKIKKILEREHGLAEELLKALEPLPVPKIDVIAVTSGPGLEPALWVGINFAKALGVAWNIPVVPINHMEGHIISVLHKSLAHAKKNSCCLSCHGVADFRRTYGISSDQELDEVPNRRSNARRCRR